MAADLEAGQAPTRRITLTGPLNFRDLGGYPGADGRMVRWRRVFRSDSLWAATPDDAAHVVDELGLLTIIDLRTAEEIDRFGPGALHEAGLEYHHVPIVDETQRTADDFLNVANLEDMYFLMLRSYGGQIADVLRLLGRHEGHPAVFHCAAGKDRTGIVAAVLLGLLGVADDDVVEDYALTAEIMPRMIERYRSWVESEQQEPGQQEPGQQEPGQQGAGRQAPPARRVSDQLFTAEAATMRKVLEVVNAEYGSLRQYAARQGVDDDVVARLRSSLLTPPS